MGEGDSCLAASPEVLEELQSLRRANAELVSQLKLLQKQAQGSIRSSVKPNDGVEESLVWMEAKLTLDNLKEQDREGQQEHEQYSVNTLQHNANCGNMNGCKRMVKGIEEAPLDRYMIRRYSRQLLVPSFGVKGQTQLLKSSILVVGAGGLGSPALIYLAAAGAGCLGLVDHDVVELNNIHRQVIHTESSIGETKVKSAAAACHAINSSLQVHEHSCGLKASNALEIIEKYDVIVDATDNLSTRYLINDACVLLGKPLVSGAALGTEGQLTVYHHNGGPCYRCIFPVPSPPDACQSCSDAGVLGVVPGIIGCLQALEAVKLASGAGEPLSKRLLILDALTSTIQTVKLRGRSSSCVVCGDNPQISKENFHEFDYEAFTGSLMSDKVPERSQMIPLSHGISCQDYRSRCEGGESHVLLDVRDTHQYQICSLPNSVNVPFSQLEEKLPQIQALSKDYDLQDEEALYKQPKQILRPIYVVCRRGNDSQKAVQFLRSKGLLGTFDIVGGLECWAREVDHCFPIY